MCTLQIFIIIIIIIIIINWKIVKMGFSYSFKRGIILFPKFILEILCRVFQVTAPRTKIFQVTIDTIISFTPQFNSSHGYFVN